MILVFIFVGMLLSGIVFAKIGGKYVKYDSLEPFGAINCALGSMGLVVLIIMIIVSHSTTQRTIQRDKIEYDGLIKRYAIIASEYEDVSKSDVIADITKWNTKVYDTKYWTSNPWTNWFNPREIADNLKYISLESEE